MHGVAAAQATKVVIRQDRNACRRELGERSANVVRSVIPLVPDDRKKCGFIGRLAKSEAHFARDSRFIELLPLEPSELSEKSAQLCYLA